MKSTQLFSVFFAIISLIYFADYYKKHTNQEFVAEYPYFKDNPYLTDQMRQKMAPYLLPLDHSLKPLLDAIFSGGRVVASDKALLDAGFEIITSATGSYVTVARHPQVPGYVFKLYLDTETRFKEGIQNWEWLTKRCVGAAKIRHIIQTKKLCYFTVPDKWLYILPSAPSTSQGVPVVVVETDALPFSTEVTEHAWKTKIKKKHLDELYEILKHGYGTIGLVRNIPYTQNKTFAFTDTEYPKRPLKLKRVLPYLSEEMQAYWTKLIK